MSITFCDIFLFTFIALCERILIGEDRARSWAYDRLIGLDGLVSAFECGCQTKFDVAEYLDVTTAFLDDALKKYKERYGIVVKYKEYFIYFYPCLAVLKK